MKYILSLLICTGHMDDIKPSTNLTKIFAKKKFMNTYQMPGSNDKFITSLVSNLWPIIMNCKQQKNKNSISKMLQLIYSINWDMNLCYHSLSGCYGSLSKCS